MGRGRQFPTQGSPQCAHALAAATALGLPCRGTGAVGRRPARGPIRNESSSAGPDRRMLRVLPYSKSGQIYRVLGLGELLERYIEERCIWTRGIDRDLPPFFLVRTFGLACV